MRFKSRRQQAAVMASLRAKGISVSQAKRMTFSQLKNRGVYLRYQADSDNDGVVNVRDCRPLDPKQQGWIHDVIVKAGDTFGKVKGEIESGIEEVKVKNELRRQAQIDEERAKIERLQERERLKIQKESMQAQQRNDIERERLELDKLRAQRRELEKERFKASSIGKAYGAAERFIAGEPAGSGKTKKKSKGFDFEGLLYGKPEKKSRKRKKKSGDVLDWDNLF